MNWKKNTTNILPSRPNIGEFIVGSFNKTNCVLREPHCMVWLFISIQSIHWGRVTHIRVSELTIIGSDKGLSPGRRQAIIRTNAGILLIGPMGTNFSEILIEIYAFSFRKKHFAISSSKWWPFCLGLKEFKTLSYPAWHPAINRSNVVPLSVAP